jgi:hypothetical protein
MLWQGSDDYESKGQQREYGKGGGRDKGMVMAIVVVALLR